MSEDVSTSMLLPLLGEEKVPLVSNVQSDMLASAIANLRTRSSSPG